MALCLILICMCLRESSFLMSSRRVSISIVNNVQRTSVGLCNFFQLSISVSPRFLTITTWGRIRRMKKDLRCPLMRCTTLMTQMMSLKQPFQCEYTEVCRKVFIFIKLYLLSRNGGEWVDGVKDMVHNTQRTNLHKITTLIESNLSKVDRRHSE